MSTPDGHQNGLFTYDSFSGTSKKTSKHFLWWCAGTHEDLLKEFPSEHSKYVGLGGVLLATFVLASLSAGYAVYSVFENVWWAITFACVWGLIIFNFDRFLVSTMRKYGVSRGKQMMMAVPRMVLALLIGITIARPLELKIFEKEINTKVAENRHKKIQLNDSLLSVENVGLLSSATQERDRLSRRKLSLEDSLHRLQQAYIAEADGTGGSMQRGIENLTRLKQEAYDVALIQSKPELEKLAVQISSQDSILNNAKANMESKRKQYEAAVTANVGFLERNKALTDLSDEESSVFWANLFISLLIILIEIGPVLSKLIMNVGPYDLALAKTELMQMAESENEMRREKQLMFDKQEGLYKRKKEISDEMIDKFAAMQSKHINNEIEQWERGERTVNNKRALNELAKKLKEQYDFEEQNVI
ncbi:MAG: DUF4407 domain-containing protein [Bacteroidetes bacterium]|nr:DUF4407 domain-containing protein [Bacteroidota bacterium]